MQVWKFSSSKQNISVMEMTNFYIDCNSCHTDFHKCRYYSTCVEMILRDISNVLIFFFFTEDGGTGQTTITTTKT